MRARMMVSRACCDETPVVTPGNTLASIAQFQYARLTNYSQQITGDWTTVTAGDFPPPVYNTVYPSGPGVPSNIPNSVFNYDFISYGPGPFPNQAVQYIDRKEKLEGFWSDDIPSGYTKVTWGYNVFYDEATWNSFLERNYQQLKDYTIRGLGLLWSGGALVFDESDFTSAAIPISESANDWSDGSSRLFDVTSIVNEITAQPGFVFGTHRVVIFLETLPPLEVVTPIVDGSGNDTTKYPRRAIHSNSVRYDP